jgi:hypothetical protein
MERWKDRKMERREDSKRKPDINSCESKKVLESHDCNIKKCNIRRKILIGHYYFL